MTEIIKIDAICIKKKERCPYKNVCFVAEVNKNTISVKGSKDEEKQIFISLLYKIREKLKRGKTKTEIEKEILKNRQLEINFFTHK